MGYACISRKILLEASEEYNIPEIKIIRAIEDAPSILDRLTRQKEKFVTYIRAALLKHVQKDNMVYHGLFGHSSSRTSPMCSRCASWAISRPG